VVRNLARTSRWSAVRSSAGSPCRYFVSWGSRRILTPAATSISMDLLAGQSVGLIREVRPAGEIVSELVEEAQQIISQRLAGLVATKVTGG
jgi:NAD(P)H-dependent flavin oxidoreductase YrpB (nitropropane dioxygenase family)